MIDSRTTPGTVFAGTSYESVQKSTNNGETWSAANAGLSSLGEVLDLALDIRTKPSTLYAATSQLGVYRSTDGGATWLADDGEATDAAAP